MSRELTIEFEPPFYVLKEQKTISFLFWKINYMVEIMHSWDLDVVEIEYQKLQNE